MSNDLGSTAMTDDMNEVRMHDEEARGTTKLCHWEVYRRTEPRGRASLTGMVVGVGNDVVSISHDCFIAMGEPKRATVYFDKRKGCIGLMPSREGCLITTRRKGSKTRYMCFPRGLWEALGVTIKKTFRVAVTVTEDEMLVIPLPTHLFYAMQNEVTQ